MLLTRTCFGIVLAGILLFVSNANASGKAPTIEGEPPRRVIAGHQWYFQPTANDPEGDKLTYKIRNKPSWATFWSGKGRLFGTPTAADVGWYGNIVIEVSDGTQTVALQSFQITVNSYNVNNAKPKISGTPRSTIGVNQWYMFRPVATDANGHSLSYSIKNKPAWASFNTNTGSLYGRPDSGDAGTYGNITIEVTDGKAGVALAPFAITVGSGGGGGGNNAPTIRGDAPAKVVTGNSYWVRFFAEDADGDSLTFKIRNKPSWAKFWADSGRLFGTPTNSDIGVHGQIVVEVSDGKSTTALPAFSIRVDGASVSNSAPSISGNPKLQVDPGRWYNFLPTASDPDDHALSYSVQNKPSWAKFNVNTGRLDGRPASSDVGSYNNIQIRVSDGIATRSLAAFSVTVGNGGGTTTRSVTLSWTPPTQNTDGSTLTNLSGYRIYYGTSQGNYSNLITINNPGVANYTVDNLAPNTYYFVSTAVNGQGVESDYSNVAVKNLN